VAHYVLLFHQAGAGDAGRDDARREHGVDEAQITAMLVDNPARYFTGGQE
jgi:hypothetical protein